MYCTYMHSTNFSFSATHQVSAILNIAQKVDKPWPLNIIDYEGVVHNVTLQPGDVLWYESARYVFYILMKKKNEIDFDE